VVEDDLVHVDVAVVERHAEGIGIAFERTGRKGRHDEATPHEGRMCRRREVIALGHDGAEVVGRET